MSAFHPKRDVAVLQNAIQLRTLTKAGILRCMSVEQILDILSKRAPVVAVLAFATTLLGRWISAPVLPFYILAVVVGLMAFALAMTKGLSRTFKSKEELGFNRNRDWIAYLGTTKGLPRGFRQLGCFGFVAVIISGLNQPYGNLAFAGYFLVIAWGFANKRYPADLDGADS